MFKIVAKSEKYGCSSNHKQISLRFHLIQGKEIVALEFQSRPHDHEGQGKAFSVVNDSENILFIYSLLHKT